MPARFFTRPEHLGMQPIPSSTPSNPSRPHFKVKKYNWLKILAYLLHNTARGRLLDGSLSHRREDDTLPRAGLQYRPTYRNQAGRLEDFYLPPGCGVPQSFTLAASPRGPIGSMRPLLFVCSRIAQLGSFLDPESTISLLGLAGYPSQGPGIYIIAPYRQALCSS